MEITCSKCEKKSKDRHAKGCSESMPSGVALGLVSEESKLTPFWENTDYKTFNSPKEFVEYIKLNSKNISKKLMKYHSE